jgi:hypothetical protein
MKRSALGSPQTFEKSPEISSRIASMKHTSCGITVLALAMAVGAVLEAAAPLGAAEPKKPNALFIFLVRLQPQRLVSKKDKGKPQWITLSASKP